MLIDTFRTTISRTLVSLTLISHLHWSHYYCYHLFVSISSKNLIQINWLSVSHYTFYVRLFHRLRIFFQFKSYVSLIFDDILIHYHLFPRSLFTICYLFISIIIHIPVDYPANPSTNFTALWVNLAGQFPAAITTAPNNYTGLPILIPVITPSTILNNDLSKNLSKPLTTAGDVNREYPSASQDSSHNDELRNRHLVQCIPQPGKNLFTLSEQNIKDGCQSLRRKKNERTLLLSWLKHFVMICILLHHYKTI